MERIVSVLNVEHIVFDELRFERFGFHTDEAPEPELRVGTAVYKDADEHYRVSLHVEVKVDGEYAASVQVTGYCQIDENHPGKEDLLKKNAVAIIFPYARAQLTLLTSQPETEPFVLPALNINALIDDIEKNKQ